MCPGAMERFVVRFEPGSHQETNYKNGKNSESLKGWRTETQLEKTGKKEKVEERRKGERG